MLLPPIAQVPSFDALLAVTQRFFVYEYDPSLPEHGYVRVTYKESITTMETDDRPYEFKPVDLVDGKYVLKKEGLIFMQDSRFTPREWCSHAQARFPSLSTNPGVDDWKHGKPVEGVPEKATWQQERVFRDILEHRMIEGNFSNEHQQQWRALHHFHESYPTADSVPPLPITLQSPDGSSFKMEHGSPFDWDAAWAKLAWRFDRPHKPKPPAGPSTEARGSDGVGDSDDAGSTAAATATDLRNPSIVNGITGGNASKLEKKHAKGDESVLAQARSLAPKGLAEVAVHQLCFAVTPEPEGELSVGVVRIEKVTPETVDFSWFQRSSDSERWPDTPIFKPCMHRGKVEKQTKVDREVLLSVPVELTEGSKCKYKADAKSIAGQQIRLLKSCMTLLRAFLAEKRPDLITCIDGSEDEAGEEEEEGEGEAGEEAET
jgi:hypothetical protein